MVNKKLKPSDMDKIILAYSTNYPGAEFGHGITLPGEDWKAPESLSEWETEQLEKEYRNPGTYEELENLSLEELWEELKNRGYDLQSCLGERDEEILDPIGNENDYSIFDPWELKDIYLSWLKEELKYSIKINDIERIDAIKRDMAQIEELLGNNKFVNASIMRMINKFEKEGPDIILSQSVQSDTMKSNYFKVKNLYEKVQDTMNKNGYELSDEDIQNITNQLLDTFEEDKNLHNLNKVVDNTNDLLSNIATIIGTGLGFMMSTRIIVNEISSASNMQLSYTWIFGIAIGIISLTLKIISSYLAKKKLLKNMW